MRAGEIHREPQRFKQPDPDVPAKLRQERLDWGPVAEALARVTLTVMAICWISASLISLRSVPRGSHHRMQPLTFSTPPFRQLAQAQQHVAREAGVVVEGDRGAHPRFEVAGRLPSSWRRFRPRSLLARRDISVIRVLQVCSTRIGWKRLQITKSASQCPTLASPGAFYNSSDMIQFIGLGCHPRWTAMDDEQVVQAPAYSRNKALNTNKCFVASLPEPVASMHRQKERLAS